MEQLKYKDFYGSAEIDLEAGVCRGKLLFIDDLVTYQSETAKGLKKEFEDAVEDYLATCAEVDKAPQKAFTGVFNVRISPDDHRKASLLAFQRDQKLNSFVAEAIRAQLQGNEENNKKIEHHHKVEITVTNQSKIVMGASDDLNWHLLGDKEKNGATSVH